MSETYEFSFERSQLLKVIGGLLSLVLLVFCAGFLVGIALQVRQPAPTLVAQTTQPQSAPAPAAVAASLIVALPEEPVADEDRPAVDASDDTAAAGPDLPAVEAANAVEAKPAASDPGKFAVQFGAFLQSENAGILAKRLTAKGYLSDVVAREDSHGRTWYLVRYGAFTNRTDAAAAAVELKTRESVDAVVRPANSM
jgi:cell division protein FtsN